MSYYIYAFTRSSNTENMSLQGVAGRPVECFTVDGIDAIISHLEKEPSDTNNEVLWEHERVIELLMQDGCVLPVRFGTCLRSKEEIASFIRSDSVTLRNDLDRLDGCIEISVSVIDRSFEPRGIYPVWVKDIHQEFADLAVAGNYTVNASALHIFTGEYLVRKEDLHSFQLLVGKIRSLYCGYKFLCTGPWPPYSFVTPHMGVVHAV